MKWKALATVASLTLLAGAAYAYQAFKPEPPVAMASAEARGHRAWDFKLTAIDGEPLPLSKFKGDVVMLVNTASFCGFTPQFKALQSVYTTYKAKGFTVIGVPSGDFKDQEYGTNKETAEFCRGTFGVKFPMTEKAHVVGPQSIPVYKWAAGVLGPENGPRWNFHKYLIGRDGKLIAAFGTKTAPDDAAVTKAIEAALKQKI
ncbi:glutathione peroxidase [Sphingomonas sp. ID0503]|uniref:glutathione peroxidase n=1 Tax=Sphingomonas sp. ID0503 TaxID=3399691 RepID=UPI003AFB3C10